MIVDGKMIVVHQDGNTTTERATRTLLPREHKLDVLEGMGEISYKVIVYPIIGLFYLVVFAMGALAVVLAAALDYAALALLAR